MGISGDYRSASAGHSFVGAIVRQFGTTDCFEVAVRHLGKCKYSSPISTDAVIVAKSVGIWAALTALFA